MKSMWKKIACAVCCLFILVALPISVFANTITQDGIEASFTTDKTSYKDTDSVTVTLQVKNGTTVPISGVTLTNLTPDGYICSNQTQEKIENYTLKSGETVSISTTFVKSVEKILTPRTGEKSNIIVPICLMILGGVLICIAYKKNKKKTTALLLCLCLLETIVPSVFIEEVKAAKVTVPKTINLCTAANVNGTEMQFCANVKYDYETDEEIVEGNISDGTGSDVSDKTDNVPENGSNGNNGSSTTTYTRGEWIRLLLDKLEVEHVNVADANYVYHFTDTENGTYGVDAETAWAYSILPEENAYTPVFNEQEIVTREYAAYTVYHIMGFEGESALNCADAEKVSYKKEVSLLINQNFFSVNNDNFAPDAALTDTDVTQIFVKIDYFNDALEIDSDHTIGDITYADGVIELQTQDYTLADNGDGTYTINLPLNEQTSTLGSGSIFAISENDTNVSITALKVESISVQGDRAIGVCVEPDISEVMDSYTIAGYATPLISQMQNENGITVEYDANNIDFTDLATFDIASIGKLEYTISENSGLPVTGTFEMNIPKISVNLKDIGSKDMELAILMPNTVKVNANLTLGTHLETQHPIPTTKVENERFYLPKIPFAIGFGYFIDLKPYINVSVNGTITVGYTMESILGVQYKDGAFRVIHDFSRNSLENPSLTYSAEAKLGLGFGVSCRWAFNTNLCEFDVNVGVVGKFDYISHNDATYSGNDTLIVGMGDDTSQITVSEKLKCMNMAAYIYGNIELYKESLFGKVLDKKHITLKWDFWKESNSPWSMVWHTENGQTVPSCTYGYGHLVGTVVDSTTGAAIGNAQIVFKEKESGEIIQTVYSSTTEDAVSELKVGDFIGKSLTVGEYSVEVSADGYKSICVDATVKKDERTEIGTISLEAVNGEGNEGGEEGSGNEKPNDPVTPTDYYKIVDVSLGASTSAVVTDDGSLYMWGNNDCGQLGNGTTEYSAEPIKIMDNVKTVITDGLKSGALLNDGSLYMWGNNVLGTLGNGTTENSTVPIKIMDNVYKLAEVGSTCMAITENYDLYVWGEQNWQCTIGDENFEGENLLVPTKILENVKDAAIDGDYFVVTTNGVLETYSFSYPFVPALSGSSAHGIIKRDVECVYKDGYNAWGFLTTDGVLYGYDYNCHNLGGQYDGSIGYWLLMENVKDASFGDDRAVIKTDGSLYIWGIHCDYNEPTYISDNIKDVCVGYKECAYITVAGDLYIWKFDEINQGSTPVLIQIERQ